MFISETAEHLQSLNRGLVSIEQNPGDQDAIAETFRNAHSVKGMAASMGYEPVRDLAHAMEDLLDEFREGATEPGPGAMDLLFKGLDILETLLQDVANDREFSAGSQELTNRIRAFRSGAPDEPAPVPGESPERREAAAPTQAGVAGGEEPDLEIAEDEIPGQPQEYKTPGRLLDMDSEVVVDFDEMPKPRLLKKDEPAGEDAGGPGDAPPDSPAFEPPSDFEFEAPSPEPPPPPTAEPAPEAEPAVEPAPEAAAPAGPLAPDKMVRVIFSSQAASPGVRALIFFKRLSEVGEIVVSRPPLDEVKGGNFLADAKGLAIEVDFASETDSDEIIKIINSLTDVVSFEIKSLDLPAGKEEAAPEPEKAALEEPAQELDRPEPVHDPFAQAPALPQTVRVKTTALDQFISALGEMILVKSELREASKKHRIPALSQGIDRLENLVRDFHDQVMSIRMMPLESVMARKSGSRSKARTSNSTAPFSNSSPTPSSTSSETA
jgi:two-component system chemotaxis sensor kinase CheA